MKNTEAIIFDLGGVILNIDYNLTMKAFEDAGVKNFNEMYSQSDADDLFSKLETGQVVEEDFYKEINNRTGLNLPASKIEKAWNTMLLTFREKSLEFLDILATKYRLFLLSNTNHIHLKAINEIYNEKIRTKPFAAYFEKIYYSCEAGMRKPDVAFFEHLLKENKLTAGKTIFIDDSVKNIEAAGLAGIQTILLEPGRFIENLDL